MAKKKKKKKQSFYATIQNVVKSYQQPINNFRQYAKISHLCYNLMHVLILLTQKDS